MNINHHVALLGLFAFASVMAQAAKAPSFFVRKGVPSPTDCNLIFNPPTSLNITCPADPVFQVQGSSCTATAVTLPSISTQNVGCSGAVTLTATSALGSGFGPFWNVAAGDYSVIVKAQNACGNEASCTFTIRVKDLKKPQISIVQTLFSNIGIDGKAQIRARMFDQNSADNCTPTSKLRFSFSQNPADSVKTISCDSLGEQAVKIFVFDEAGNFASKNSKFSVADPLAACQTFFLAGKIETEKGAPIHDVDLKITFDGLVLNEKAAKGTFFIDDLPTQSNVVLQPLKKMNPLNGVSSYDLSMLAKHVLGQEKLDSPFKILAADVNRSNHVSTADLVLLRRLILGEITEFPNSDAWRFVPSAFQFADPANPFLMAAPEKMQFLAGSGDQFEADFTGIKMGDLNGSANAQNLTDETTEDRSDDAFSIHLFDQNFEANQDIEIVFEANLAEAEAIQTTLNFDANALIINELEANEKAHFSKNDFSESQKAAGKITLAWAKTTASSADQKQLFTLKCTAQKTGKLSDFLQLGDLPTRSEAYSNGGQKHSINLVFDRQNEKATTEKPAVSSLQIFQNQPNPMTDATTFFYETSVAENIVFKITAPATGRLVFEKKTAATVGQNRLEISKNDLGGAAGLLFVSIQTSLGTATKSMIAAAN